MYVYEILPSIFFRDVSMYGTNPLELIVRTQRINKPLRFTRQHPTTRTLQRTTTYAGQRIQRSTHCRKPSGHISSRDLRLSRCWKCCSVCRSTSLTRGCAPVGCSAGGCGEEEDMIERTQRVISPEELTALEHKWILRIPHILGNPHAACRQIKCFDGGLGISCVLATE